MSARSKFEILVVEDNPADITLLELLFREVKIPVRLHFARDGREGLDFVFKHGKFTQAPTPDLILIDRNLPIKNGGELLRAIKEDPRQRQIPVIMLTTSNNHAEIEEAYLLGVNAFISKPIDIDKYQEMIHTLCRFWFECADLSTRPKR